MNNILIYCRTKNIEPLAEQTACVLSEQLQHLGQHQAQHFGLHIEISQAINLPRLLLNSYQTVHYIIENLPLNVNEAFYLGLCKAMGKSTILSVLNSDKKMGSRGGLSGLVDFTGLIIPDAFSVSQTSHLKLYRNITCNKFILPAFPKTDQSNHRFNEGPDSLARPRSFLIPLQNTLEEAFELNIDSPTYFDGRKLLRKQSSSKLRKKWTDLIANKKLNSKQHLILSENKLNQLITEEALVVVLADPCMTNTEFTNWLSICMNKNNLIVLNDFQATGFANYWTSGRNCYILSATDWPKNIKPLLTSLENKDNLSPTHFVASELFQSIVNELSRLYVKLWQQKTSLLTSGSVKL